MSTPTSTMNEAVPAVTLDSSPNKEPETKHNTLNACNCCVTNSEEIETSNSERVNKLLSRISKRNRKNNAYKANNL